MWSRYRATRQEVWDTKTDLAVMKDEFAPVLRIVAADEPGLVAALRESGTGTFDAVVTSPGGVWRVDWPITVVESVPPHHYRDQSTNRVVAEFDHHHRFEDTPAGLTRYVDDVVFVPAIRPARMVATLLRRFFMHRHHRLARHLPVDGDAKARAWLRRVDARIPLDVDPGPLPSY